MIIDVCQPMMNTTYVSCASHRRRLCRRSVRTHSYVLVAITWICHAARSAAPSLVHTIKSQTCVHVRSGPHSSIFHRPRDRCYYSLIPLCLAFRLLFDKYVHALPVFRRPLRADSCSAPPCVDRRRGCCVGLGPVSLCWAATETGAQRLSTRCTSDCPNTGIRLIFVSVVVAEACWADVRPRVRTAVQIQTKEVPARPSLPFRRRLGERTCLCLSTCKREAVCWSLCDHVCLICVLDLQAS